eukprot:4238209-Pyramimonas_sp.AAC.1
MIPCGITRATHSDLSERIPCTVGYNGGSHYTFVLHDRPSSRKAWRRVKRAKKHDEWEAGSNPPYHHRR